MRATVAFPEQQDASLERWSLPLALGLPMFSTRRTLVHEPHEPAVVVWRRGHSTCSSQVAQREGTSLPTLAWQPPAAELKLTNPLTDT